MPAAKTNSTNTGRNLTSEIAHHPRGPERPVDRNVIAERTSPFPASTTRPGGDSLATHSRIAGAPENRATEPSPGSDQRPEMSDYRRTLGSMSARSAVPAWVRPPLREARAAADVLLRQHATSNAPASLGAWATLEWLRQAPEETTPVSKLRRDPTQIVALAEIQIASWIAVQRPYPGPEWWAQQGVRPEEILPRSFWEDLAGYGWSVEFATGVAQAFGWLAGLHERATCMVPRRNGDGVRFSKRERQAMAFSLFRLDYPDGEVRRMLTAPCVDPSNL